MLRILSGTSSKSVLASLLALSVALGAAVPSALAVPPQAPVHMPNTALLLTDSSPTAMQASTEFQTAYRQGVLSYRHGNYASALTSFYRAEEMDPDHVNTHYYLGLVLDAMNKPADASKYFSLVSAYGSEASILMYSRQRLSELTASEKASKESSLASAVSAPALSQNQSLRSTLGQGLSTTVTQMTQTLQASLESGLQQGIEGAVKGALSPEKPIKPSITIPLMNQSNALMVSAELNSKASGVFVVDTGATYTSISQELADSLGSGLRYVGTVKITTANGQIDVPKVIIDRVRINGLEARNVEATVINLHKGSFSGLLGLSFLRQFQLTINPKANELVFQSI